ncbi:FkbM family methyltransferase [Alteraurantiacibacter aquimixticola]|uniref:FkbM family methyltransferase n=1 Tax=Alteraurantiacibacter aquimixticola TaxID=2489173 RepID=A0A4T3F3K9_9SPHN|nr:FkbM family methyltransferase [Alteraurantiacibacter aquimixticola]TIX51856.1 FkbM family methyltransferase [Alteraurantiacibacter aquimixticola]
MQYITVAERSESVFTLCDDALPKREFRRRVEDVLRYLTNRLGRIAFVQVGANDGAGDDMVNAFVKTGRWHGILVEPLPGAMASLQQEYAGLPRLHFEQLAIWPDDNPPAFWQVNGASVLSSFSREAIMMHAAKYEDLAAMLEPIEVQTERLGGLCNRHGVIPEVIAMDCEGNDDVVLSTFDLAANRVPVILFEHVFLSSERSAALRDRLEGLGYRLLFDRHDCLAVQPAALPPLSE